MFKNLYKISFFYLTLNIITQQVIAQDPTEIDFSAIHIAQRQDTDDLSIRFQPLNTVGILTGNYDIDGVLFSCQNVSGNGMRCFFNAAGLNVQEEIIKLKSNKDDLIIRYMIANEIVSSARTPKQLHQAIKEIIQYDIYAKEQKEIDELEEERNALLGVQSLEKKPQNPSPLSPRFQNLAQRGDIALDALRRKASTIKSYMTFINKHIGNEQMMVALYDSKGDKTYTSIDAIAYLNHFGLKIYQPSSGGGLRLAHQFIPEHAKEIVYLYHEFYHEGGHFQALKRIEGTDLNHYPQTQIVSETREEFLMSFLEDALKNNFYHTPEEVEVKILDNLEESPDRKDYIRFLNIRRLLNNRPTSNSIDKKIHWLSTLSKQVDALSIHEGSLREIITPKGKNTIFWRRLSYLHHGLNISLFDQDVKEFIITKIWESGELDKLTTLIERFFESSIFEARSNILRIRNTWIDRMVNVLAWPRYTAFFWFYSSAIPSAHKIKNFSTFLEAQDKDEEKQKQKQGYVVIHPYLRGDLHPDGGPVILGKTREVIKRRAKDIHKETFDSRKGFKELMYDEEKYEKLKTKVKELKEKRDDLNDNLRSAKKDNPADKESIQVIVDALGECKKEIEKEENRYFYLAKHHEIEDAVMKLVDNFESFGSLELDPHFKKFDAFYKSIDQLEFPLLSSYIGLLSEIEHLEIAKRHLDELSRPTSASELDAIFHVMSLTAEALNNTSLESSKTLESIAEVMRFLRNKVVEHKTKVVKERLARLKLAKNIDAFTSSLISDLEKVRSEIHSYLVTKKSDVTKQEAPRVNLSSKSRKKQSDVSFIPVLDRLRHYFMGNLSLEELLSDISQTQSVAESSQLQSSSIQEDTEVYTLGELEQYIGEMDELLRLFPTRKALAENLSKDLMLRLKFFRTLNDIKESFSYLSENMDAEYLDRVQSVFNTEVLWYLYYDLRDRRNLVTHDLWRTDIHGLINTSLRIQAILKPALEGKKYPKHKKLGLEKDSEIEKFLEDAEKSENINGMEHKGLSPLFFAVYKENEALVKEFLKKGANPNVIVNRQGDTLLHFTLEHSFHNSEIRRTIISLLLGYGALTDTRNAHGDTPYRILTKDSKNIHSEELSLLRQYQSYRRGLEADQLHTDIRWYPNTSNSLKQLLTEENYSLDLYDEHGETPLCISISEGYFNEEDNDHFLKYLLKHADPNVGNYSGLQEFPLHLAVLNEDLDLVTSLVEESRANISQPNAELTTPLHYAVGNVRDVEIVEYLLSQSANVHARDYIGLSPILVAPPEMIEPLLDAEANPNDRDGYGETVLEKNKSFKRIRKILIEKGAFPLIRTTMTIASDLRLDIPKRISIALQNGLSFEAVLRRLKNHKKFIFPIGSYGEQLCIIEDLTEFIRGADIDPDKRNSLLSLLPGHEYRISGLEDFIKPLIASSEPEKLSKEEEFLKDLDNTLMILEDIRLNSQKTKENMANFSKLEKYIETLYLIAEGILFKDSDVNKSDE